MATSLYIYIYIYIERERERERADSKISVTFIFSTADIEGSIIDFKKHNNSDRGGWKIHKEPITAK